MWSGNATTVVEWGLGGLDASLGALPAPLNSLHCAALAALVLGLSCLYLLSGRDDFGRLPGPKPSSWLLGHLSEVRSRPRAPIAGCLESAGRLPVPPPLDSRRPPPLPTARLARPCCGDLGAPVGTALHPGGPPALPASLQTRCFVGPVVPRR